MKEPILFSSIVNGRYQRDFWYSVRNQSANGGKFMIDLSVRYNPNRFVARTGEWSLPWKQTIPEKYRLPTYDPNFNLSYDEVTDLRANTIKDLINEKGQKFAVTYSGGIDSTVVLSALIKNLSKQELKNVVVCCSRNSIVENPKFYQKFIHNKFNIIESLTTKNDDLIEKGYRPITADEGDCIFGTVFGLDCFQHYDYYCSLLPSRTRNRLIKIKKEVMDRPYEDYKEIILEHFKIRNTSLNIEKDFTELWYRKLVKNIESCDVPVHTIFDFFWWIIFNLKYVSCAMRSSIYLNDRMPIRSVVNDHVINWFNSKEYQLWSMTNNNNGEKIQALGVSTYKAASRKYIYDLDKNPWYYYFKLKLPSLGGVGNTRQLISHLSIEHRPNARFGVDHNYDLMYIDDPKVQNFIISSMSNFKIDW